MTQQKNKKMELQTVLILLLIGLFAGVLSGVIGIGGGIVIVPALVYFIGFSQRTAQGTSLAILLLPIGLLGVIQFYKAGYVDVKVTVVIALAFFIGSYFGSRIALNVSQEILKKCFAVLLIIIAVKMLFFDKRQDDKKDIQTATTHISKLLKVVSFIINFTFSSCAFSTETVHSFTGIVTCFLSRSFIRQWFFATIYNQLLKYSTLYFCNSFITFKKICCTLSFASSSSFKYFILTPKSMLV